MFQRFRRMLIESLAERINFANIYYIDPSSGNDNNSGLSPDQAFRSPLNVVSQYFNLQPPGHVDLQPGDSVVLMPGEHNFAYSYGEGQWQGLFFRNIHGTADNPITIRGLPGATVRNQAPADQEMSAIYVLQSSYITLEGLDVSSRGSAVTVADSRHVTVRNNYIHDADGIAYDNLSGLYLNGVRDVWVQDNFFVDNFDRMRPGNQNNRHIVLFGSADVHIVGNTMFNHQPNTGRAVDYKHLGGLTAAETGGYEVAYNTIVNAYGVGIGSAAPNSYIHHNLLIDSGAIRLADFGGTDQQANQRVEFNTILNTTNFGGAGAFEFNPNEYPGYPLGPVHWNNNLVADYRTHLSPDDSTFIIDRYGDDSFYTRVLAGNLFHADGNVYHANRELRFDTYGANGGRYGTLGEVRTFSQWQASGYDRSGAVTDLALDTFYRSQAPAAQQAGIYAGGSPRITALTERFDIAESGRDSERKVRLVRSGPLDQSLSVSVSVSRGQQIAVPATVVFAAGSATAELTVSGLPDAVFEPTTSIQLKFAATGWQGSSTWLLVHDTPSEPAAMEGIFQVPGQAGTAVQLRSSVLSRWAEYDNEMGVAYVDDANGRVGNLSPDQPGWIQAVLKRGQHQVVLQAGASEGDRGQVDLTAGRYVVFYLVQDSSTATWLSSNASNSLANKPLLFTSIPTSNPDKFDHVHETVAGPVHQLAWEDLEFGGDLSFRDLVVENQFAERQSNYCQAVDDTFSTFAEDSLSVIFPLANDTASDQVRIAQVTQPASGSVSIGVSGRELIYTPTVGKYGTFPFQYTIESEGQTSTADVNMVVSKRWTNPVRPTDVNNDGMVSPLDALLLINVLNETLQAVTIPFPQGEQATWGMYDVNADGHITVLDALIVVVDLL